MLKGSGSSVVAPLQLLLTSAFTGAKVSYTGSTSGVGIQALKDGQADFSCSEGGLVALEKAGTPDIQQLPLFTNGIAVIYNVPGISVTDRTLNLTTQLLVDIYAERVTQWNDPRLVALNPSFTWQLPNAPITRFVRNDSCGVTLLFTTALQVFTFLVEFCSFLCFESSGKFRNIERG